MFRLTDTETLDRTAMSCALAGALCLAAGAAVAAGARAAGAYWPGDATAWMALAGPAFLATAVSRGHLAERLRTVLFGAAGVAAMLVWGRDFPGFAQASAGALLGTAFAVENDRKRKRESRDRLPRWAFAATAAAVAVAWPIAVLATGSVEHSVLANGMVPPLLLGSAAGALSGLATGLASFPSHLERVGDRVLEALQKARPVLDGELRDLVLKVVDARGRALKLLERSRADATARVETERGLDQIALTAIDLADRFGAVDRVLARTPMPGLDERVAATRSQLDGTKDPGVRRDLERALQALEDQRSQVDRLLQGRARLVARLQSELASLEKTEMALALLATGDAAMAGLRLETLGSTLEHRAHELEAEGAALQETLVDSPVRALERIRGS